MSRTRIAALLLDGVDTQAKRDEISRIFHQTSLLYERLFDHLANNEAWYRKAIPLRHPLIFYFGHTATFFVNKLQVAGLINQRLNPHLESIFAVGVDEMSWDDLDEQHYDWPAIEEVRVYRAMMREQVEKVIHTLPLELPITWNSPWWAILMGIEHEYIHLETSSVLMRQLPLSLLREIPDWEPWEKSGLPPENRLLPVGEGEVRLGKTHQNRLYGWDNEYGKHEILLKAFSAGKYLVSNHEFLPFVEADGYDNPRWWTEEGDRWRRFAKIRHPCFWVADANNWKLRLIASERPMPWDWPVEVNALEAEAFCAWKSARDGILLRLPSEDEWRRLRDLSTIPDIDEWKETPANIGLAYGASPCPVSHFCHGDFYDVIGNVWQWTATPTYPFNGFAVHPYYDDFTIPTFDQQHNLIKGGSFASLGNEMQREARYAFRRHFFQHAGFRYVQSSNPLPEVPVYESDAAISQYCDFHYGPEHFGVRNFPSSIASLAIKAMQKRPLRRALDIGCAVGRSSFELAQYCPEVIGLDFSARFIQVATRLRDHESFTYTLTEEGDLHSYHHAMLADLGLAETASRVQFFQADACNLKPLYQDFDLVVAANLIDRLYKPRQFLEEIAKRMSSGGILVLSSPYTWLTEHTPHDEWLGGFKRDGENFTTLEALRELLAPSFILAQDPLDQPFVIRETARKYQHSLAQVTVWERK